MEIAFITSVAVIAADPPESRKLYVEALGLPLEGDDQDGYFHSEKIGGSKHFGVWPLAQAAEACFGTSEWPPEKPVPQVSLEFEVQDREAVQAAAQELQAKGYLLLHPVREEPWGQTIVRLLSIEGSIVGVSYAPSLHD
jgi:catechol 2,3-dioxygenase-like lactoylglutathione lyase family enzyme